MGNVGQWRLESWREVNGILKSGSRSGNKELGVFSMRMGEDPKSKVRKTKSKNGLKR